jgi:hypothetical protein
MFATTIQAVICFRRASYNRSLRMFNRQCGASTHNNSPHEIKFQYPVHQNIVHSDTPWNRHLLRAETISSPMSERSHTDTETQAYNSSGHSGSFDSYQSNGPLALEAQQLWESVSRIRDQGSNFSSICSSASTLSSATMCTQPQLSFANAMVNDTAPSFNFMMHRVPLDATTHHPFPHPHATPHASFIDPWLRAGFTGPPAGQRHTSSLRDEVSAQEHHLEEFSLGSGYPG